MLSGNSSNAVGFAVAHVENAALIVQIAKVQRLIGPDDQTIRVVHRLIGVPADPVPIKVATDVLAAHTRDGARTTANVASASRRFIAEMRAQAAGGGGIRNVLFTYSMLARVSATMSFVGDPVSRTYQPR